MKRLALTVALILLAANAARADGVLIEGFYWDATSPDKRSWWDFLSDHAAEFKKIGVTGVWAPPATKGAGGGFSDGYDLYDYYDLGSKDQMGSIPTRYGSKEQFLNFVAVCHANGIDVYSDIVMNQRCGGGQGGVDYSHLVGSEAVGRFTMGPWDFHPSNSTGDWSSWLIGLPDVAQENPVTRQHLFDWIRWFDKQTGVDGYRIDAAKHMPFDFQEGALYQVQEGMGQKRFAMAEYYDGNPNTLAYYVGATHRRTSVLDFTTFFNILRNIEVQGGYFDMRQLGYNRFMDFEKAITFVNTHDTFERGNGLEIFTRANLCYAFTLSAANYPCVFWKDLYDNNGVSRPYLANLIWISHTFARGAQIERWADNNLYVLEREGNLLTGINNDEGAWRTEWVQTGFGSNVHLHDYAGHQPDAWTNQDGWVQISVPPGNYVCFARDGFESDLPINPARRTTQETEGNVDMDTAPAHEKWGQPIRFTSDAGQPIHVEVYLGNTALACHVCLLDAQGNRLNHARGVGSVKLDFNNPPAAGWYQVRVGLEITAKNNETPCWAKITYQAPPTRSTQLPDPSKIDTHVLPLVSSSVGP
jgi:alpha-amylase